MTEEKFGFKDDTEKKEVKKEEKASSFQSIPQEAKDALTPEEMKEYTKEEPIGIPYEENSNINSYLTLVLSPNLRDLELMIRGLEYVKRYNRVLKKEEIILRKVKDHPLNEYGINKILSELKIYCSPEIKLGRKTEKYYYNSVNHVCHTIVRLIYKNLKSFGMDTQEKQRAAKTFCTAIIEFVDASFSRSVEGKENDLSRGELKIEGNLNGTPFIPETYLSPKQKEEMKN